MNCSEDVNDSKDILKRALGEMNELVIDAVAASTPVLVDRGQVQQMLLKLALNARDAMPGGGTLTISIENRDWSSAKRATSRAVPGV
jgi:signal transduction histidine kinase